MSENKNISNNISIFIIGNGGTGKTTLASSLSNQLKKSLVISEMPNNPFSSLFYNNKKRWSFTCQLNYLWSYIQHYENNTKQKKRIFYIFDSGAWTNTEVYVKALYDFGLLSKVEYTFYLKIASYLLDTSFYPHPKIVIYLKAPSEVCYKRMKKRAWNFQQNSTLFYVAKLSPYYECLANKFKKKSIPVISINTAKIDIRSKSTANNIVKQIKTLLRGKNMLSF